MRKAVAVALALFGVLLLAATIVSYSKYRSSVADYAQATAQQELAVNQQQLAEKRLELATVFYAMGSKKELIQSGVVEAKGGVLGFGKTLEPSGRFERAVFTALDTDEESVIRIPADKAQVLSAQPISSYVIQPVGKDVVELRIQNPRSSAR